SRPSAAKLKEIKEKSGEAGEARHRADAEKIPLPRPAVERHRADADAVAALGIVTDRVRDELFQALQLPRALRRVDKYRHREAPDVARGLVGDLNSARDRVARGLRAFLGRAEGEL